MRRVHALFGYVYERTFNTAKGVVRCRTDTVLYDVPYVQQTGTVVYTAKSFSNHSTSNEAGTS